MQFFYTGPYGGGGTFCALITAKKNYKHCLVIMESRWELSVMAPHAYDSPESSPSHQVAKEVKKEIKSLGAKRRDISRNLQLLNILLVLPVGMATPERSFGQMKLAKNCLQSRFRDINLGRLCIAIIGHLLSTVAINQILNLYKQ